MRLGAGHLTHPRMEYPSVQTKSFSISTLSSAKSAQWHEYPHTSSFTTTFVDARNQERQAAKQRQDASSLLTPLPSCSYIARKTLMEVLQKGHSHAKRLDLVCESDVNTLQGLESRSHRGFMLDLNSPRSRAS